MTSSTTTRTALLTAVGACAAEKTRAFANAAVSLEEAATTWNATPNEETRAAVRDSFGRAMDSWQVVEQMQFGPTAARSMAGGQDFRDNIYSWPLVSRCAVEEELVAVGYQSPGLAAALINRRGLAAMEYLAFYSGDDTACPASSPLIAKGTWAALSADERAARKRAYTAAAAADVRGRAVQLADAWAPEVGNFAAKLAAAGPGNATYPTAGAAMDAITNALFYIESEVKDRKLAPALGLRDCAGSTCPELLESRFAGRSKANIAGNIDGLRLLLEGCGHAYDGVGFDDLLVGVGADAVAATLRQRLQAARAAVDAIEEADLEAALQADPASVRGLYDALKAVTDVLKTDLVTLLDLELPGPLVGDND